MKLNDWANNHGVYFARVRDYSSHSGHPREKYMQPVYYKALWIKASSWWHLHKLNYIIPKCHCATNVIILLLAMKLVNYYITSQQLAVSWQGVKSEARSPLIHASTASTKKQRAFQAAQPITAQNCLANMRHLEGYMDLTVNRCCLCDQEGCIWTNSCVHDCVCVCVCVWKRERESIWCFSHNASLT